MLKNKMKRIYIVCIPSNTDALVFHSDDEVIEYLRDQWGSEYSEEYENGSLSSYTDSLYVVENTLKIPSFAEGKSEWEKL